MTTSESTTSALTDIYLDVLAECGYLIPTDQEAPTYSVERGWHVPDEPLPQLFAEAQQEPPAGHDVGCARASGIACDCNDPA